jgi:hypothetical protein
MRLAAERFFTTPILDRAMPILPLDHPDPLAATLGIMLYPGQDESDQKLARAWAAQYLAEPVRHFREEAGAIGDSVLAQLPADSGMPLENVRLRWRDGIAMGQMLELSLL